MRTRSLILLVLPVTLAFLGAACLIPTTASAADFTGKVVGVIDGDTVKVLHNGKADRIRLSGIDCPEKGQAFGKRAKQAASALAFEKEVTIRTHGKDTYKRTLGDDAREARKGLWTDPQPVPSWEWRKRSRRDRE